MVKLTKKSKVALVAIVVFVVILVIAVPFVSAQAAASNAVGNIKTLNAKGFAIQTGESQDKFPANFTMALQATPTNDAVKKFDVTAGTVVVNGVSYAITDGKGGVATGRHLILLQAHGTDSNGQTVTLKLDGRYFWMGGHLYVARIAAKLQTENQNYTLLMRAAIRV
jgi:hypothetical protein